MSKFFGQLKVFENFHVQIPEGQITGLVGPDGAGKTTLLRLMASLLRPTSGSVKVNASLGYMPQRFGLYEDLTVMENLVLYADLNGVLGDERKKTFEKLLKFTDLARFTDRQARYLSGGMKQKLGLACTLIHKPKLLLLDEPSVGVDPLSRRELWKMVQELVSEGVSIVWSTCYLDEAERCSRVLLLNNGQMLYDGDPQSLTHRMDGRVFALNPSSKDKREALFDIVNREDVIDGTIQGAHLRIVTKTPHALSGLDCTSIPPRFEDAFIDMLGGCPKGFSKLAEKMPPIEAKDKPVIVADNLTKAFGNFIAADRVSFEVKPGEVFGLLGPNGAGKSTLFKMLCGLLKITSGKAIVYGESLLSAPAVARSHIGYMAQKFSLYEGISVFQNLQFYSGVYNLSGRAQKDVIEAMIEIFDFQPFLKDSGSALPLGYKQRLALACAVMHHPKVLFLDEPTSGIDPIARREFWNHINGLVEKGTTIVITTHFMDEAEYCDRIGLIFQGKIITIGTPDQLKEKAQTEKNPTPTLEDAFIHLIENNHAD